MRQSEKERLIAMLEQAAGGPDRTAVYDAIATAERDEPDVETQRALHDAAVELLHSQHDSSRIERVQQLLSAIQSRD